MTHRARPRLHSNSPHLISSSLTANLTWRSFTVGRSVPSPEPAWSMLAVMENESGTQAAIYCSMPTRIQCLLRTQALCDSHPLSVSLSFVTIYSLPFLKLVVSLSRQPPFASPDGFVWETHSPSHYPELLPRMHWQLS